MVHGASYFINPVRRPGRSVMGEEVDGLLQMRLAKDRGGWLRGRFRGDSPVVADIDVISYPDGGVLFHINPPDTAPGKQSDALGDEIIEHLWLMNARSGDERGEAARAIAMGIGRDERDKGTSTKLKDFVKSAYLSVTKKGAANLYRLTVSGEEAYRDLLDGLDGAS